MRPPVHHLPTTGVSSFPLPLASIVLSHLDFLVLRFETLASRGLLGFPLCWFELQILLW